MCGLGMHGADTPEEVPYPKDAIDIQDGRYGSLHAWYNYVLTNLPQTCGDIFLRVLDLNKNFVFCTDCYHTDSIERLCVLLTEIPQSFSTSN